MTYMTVNAAAAEGRCHRNTVLRAIYTHNATKGRQGLKAHKPAPSKVWKIKSSDFNKWMEGTK